MIPLHAAPIGHTLPANYFSPGTVTMHGQEIGSPWAIAYWQGESFRYERAGLGAPWVRVS